MLIGRNMQTKKVNLSYTDSIEEYEPLLYEIFLGNLGIIRDSFEINKMEKKRDCGGMDNKKNEENVYQVIEFWKIAHWLIIGIYAT